MMMILRLSGPKDLVLLQLVIPLVTWSVVNVTADVIDLPFWGKPVMRTHWMTGASPPKSGSCRDKSRSDNNTQTSLNLRYLP